MNIYDLFGEVSHRFIYTTIIFNQQNNIYTKNTISCTKEMSLNRLYVLFYTSEMNVKLMEMS